MGIITDARISKSILNDLKKLNENIVPTTVLATVDEPICTHPDIQINFVRSDLAVCPPELYDYYRKTLPSYVDIVCGTALGRTYPSHTAYNVAKVGKYVICNSKFTDSKILELYTKTGCEIINVKQGYAKCNLCTLNECAVITEDRGIAKTLSEYDVDVLAINVGGVKLDGFEYGFIGGASGKIGDTLVFLGNIEVHSEFESIAKFLNKYGINYFSAGNNSLCDYGSLLEF